MKKLITYITCLFTLLVSLQAFAILSMELTRGVAGAIPITVVPFANVSTSPQNISNIIGDDLQNSGRFKVSGKNQGTNNVVTGKINSLGNNRYQISFQLSDTLRGNGEASIVLTKNFTVPAHELRLVAHHISDLIYQHLTGVRGYFSTKIAYVVVQHSGPQTRYILEVADQDGYNPKPLLNSPEPIMSPSWAPTGKQIAYVSFEHKRASIYVQNVITGSRRLLSEFPGINGAPAWSPDGRKLALVLSKNGSPNIYLMDIASNSLRQVTHDFYINTEPAWSPDGRTLLYTSNRSGGSRPQIYQINLASGDISRISYDGDYNARASYTRDGRQIAMIHRVSGIYNIALLDLDAGTTRVLNSAAGDSSSPSVAPNGSMILYDTYANGRTVLGMVSSDGRIQLVLPARNGDAQDPAWSPFLN
jgi:TolB protein